MKISKYETIAAGTMLDHNGEWYEIGAYNKNRKTYDCYNSDGIKTELLATDLIGSQVISLPHRINIESEGDRIEINIVLHDLQRVSFTKFINISDLEFETIEEAKEAADEFYCMLMEELDSDYSDYPLTRGEETEINNTIEKILTHEFYIR